jgi:hypothetical protein
MKQMQTINIVVGNLEVRGSHALEDGRNPFEIHDKLHALKGKILAIDFEISVAARAISTLSCGGVPQDGNIHGVCNDLICTLLDLKS